MTVRHVLVAFSVSVVGSAIERAEGHQMPPPRSSALAPAERPAPVPNQWQLMESLPAPVMRFGAEEPVIDAGLEASHFPPLAGDLDATIDVQITQEIIDKANELGTPQAMYEFVRNECRFQTYFGSQKGSVETLHQGAGNDYDLASLLIALYRSQSIPARYGVGTIELTAAEARSWLGVDDAEVAGSILFTNGMEGVNLVDGGGNVVAVRCKRVWVEVFVSQSYGSPAWVVLDPAFKPLDIVPGQDVPAAMALDAHALVEDYWDPTPPVALPRTETVVEFFDQAIQDYLDVHQPGTTVDDVRRGSTIQPLVLGLLPGSLPYTVRSRDTQYSEIPANRRYQLRFHLYDGATTLLDHTVDLPTVAGGRVTIDYVGATPGDQATIDANGGIYQTPPATVSLTPVLRLAGAELAVGANGIGMALTHSSDLHFLAPTNDLGLPVNVVPSIFNTMLAGAAEAHAFAIEGTAEALALEPPADDTEGSISILWDAGMDYLARVRNGDLAVGSMMHGYVTTGVTNAIVSNVVDVTFDGMGNPLTFDWAGLVLDADRAVLGYWPVDGLQASNLEPKDFLVVGGAEASLLESLIYEDDYGQDSVSTMKLLQLAVDAGVTVYKRWSSLPLPANTQPAAVQTALQNAILSGHEVTFPADPMTIGSPSTGEWVGTAWIDMDPNTGAAGYIISGGLNGGATVESWPPEFIDLTEDDKTVTKVEIKMKGGVSPVGDSPDPAALYTRDNEENLTFEYQIEVTYDDASMKTLPSATTYYERTTRNTTKTFVPGNYKFRVWVSRRVWWVFNSTIAQAERNVSIVGVLITDAACMAPPEFLCAKPPTGPTPSVKVKALVVPEKAPDGTDLASGYAWSGGAKLSFKTPTTKTTDIEPAGTDASTAYRDQDVDVVVDLPGGKTANGYAKLRFAKGGMDEKHKMTVVKVDMLTATGADEVPPVGNMEITHFVTPKGNAGDEVTLTATILPNAQEVRDMLDWEGATEDASDRLEAKVPKGAAAKAEVKIKFGGQVCKEARVWTVWCDVAGTKVGGPTLNLVTVRPPVGAVGPGGSVQATWDFTATIEPATIITDADRPDLTGAPTSNVPNHNAKHANDGKPYGQPTLKWDISRAWRVRALSPVVSTNDMWDLKGIWGGTLYDNLPNANLIQVPYPGNDIEGNDDSGNTVEDDDPYGAPNVGKLTDHDPPNQPFVLDRATPVGSTIEYRLQFREFVRLEIDGTWHRVSGNFLWRLHSKMEKVWIRGGRDGQPGVAGVDEDADGQADDTMGPYATPEANPTNGVDDDGDGTIDDTAADPAGMPEPYGAGDDDDKNNNNMQDGLAGGGVEGHWADDGSVSDATNNGW